MALTCKAEGSVTKPVCQQVYLVKLTTAFFATALPPKEARTIKNGAKK